VSWLGLMRLRPWWFWLCLLILTLDELAIMQWYWQNHIDEIITYLRYIDESLITYLSRNCSQIITSQQKNGLWRFWNENAPVSILEEKRRPVSKLERWWIGYQHI
jgi:hypothetical protein